MSKKIDYSKITSRIIQRGEEIFPFNGIKGIYGWRRQQQRIDWKGIEKWLDKFSKEDLEKGVYEI